MRGMEGVGGVRKYIEGKVRTIILPKGDGSFDVPNRFALCNVYRTAIALAA